MRIAAISDLHGRLPPVEDVPEVDILILAGDYEPYVEVYLNYMFYRDTFNPWLMELAEKKVKKIVGIAGNHDGLLEARESFARGLAWTYLLDESIEVCGLKVYGTPYTRNFCSWHFMESEDGLQKRFAAIPEGLDILVTHGPPFGTLDISGYDHLGSIALYDRISEMEKPPKLHFFGHIHGSYGTRITSGTHYANVAYCNEAYMPGNPMQVFDLTL